jgi:hypothetical protein
MSQGCSAIAASGPLDPELLEPPLEPELLLELASSAPLSIVPLELAPAPELPLVPEPPLDPELPLEPLLLAPLPAIASIPEDDPSPVSALASVEECAGWSVLEPHASNTAPATTNGTAVLEHTRAEPRRGISCIATSPVENWPCAIRAVGQLLPTQWRQKLRPVCKRARNPPLTDR